MLQETEDAAAGVSLEVVPCPAARPVDVDDERALATVAPLAALALLRLTQDRECDGLNQGRPVRDGHRSAA